MMMRKRINALDGRIAALEREAQERQSGKSYSGIEASRAITESIIAAWHSPLIKEFEKTTLFTLENDLEQHAVCIRLPEKTNLLVMKEDGVQYFIDLLQEKIHEWI